MSAHAPRTLELSRKRRRVLRLALTALQQLNGGAKSQDMRAALCRGSQVLRRADMEEARALLDLLGKEDE